MPAEPVESVDELPAPMWAEGLAVFHHHALAPWLALVDRAAYATQVDRTTALAPAVIAGAHSPVVTGASVARGIGHLRELPDVTPPPHPGQHVLDAALTGSPA